MCSVCCHSGKNFDCWTAVASVATLFTAIAALVTAIASFFTIRYARKSTEIAKDALEESQKARKSASFNTLFAQLMNNHISIFSNETLKVTRIKDQNSDSCKFFKSFFSKGTRKTDKSVFTSFFEHCNEKLNPSEKTKSSVIINSTFIKDTLYNNFLNTLVDSSDFSRCFKFVYHEIKTVQNTFTEKEKDERKHYIGIIQASMNYDELFAYFINLLQHFANKKEDKNFLELLKEDEFFKNLTEGHSTKYKDIITDIYNTTDPRIKDLAGLIIDEKWLK